MQTPQFQRLQGASMGFLAGYVDTLGFVALFGLFTAHVTGNFVLIAAAMADPAQTPSLLKLLAFPAFILGVAAARLLVASCEGRAAPAAKPVYLLQLVLLLGFMACGMLAEPVGPETYRLTGPNLQEALVSVRKADNGKYQGVVRLSADGPDLAVTEPVFDNLFEAWEATFELYRQKIIV